MEDVIAYWKPTTGNDLNDGLTWATAKKTYAALEALVTDVPGSLIVNLRGSESVTENITPADFIRGSIIGDARLGQQNYLLVGAADANPMLNLSGVNKNLLLHNVYLLSLTANKSYIVINATAAGIMGLRLSGLSQLAIVAAGQIGIRLDDFIIGNPIDNILFASGGAGPFTGSYYIQSNKTTTPVAPVLVRNVIFLFAAAGVAGIEEPAIYNVAAGAIDCCKFYNCTWVRINADGSYTLMTARNTYPSGANAANRDPEPNRAIDWNLILPQLKLATRTVEDGSIITDKTETETAIATRAAPSDILTDVAHKVDGELITTNLDVQVSTRATPANVTAGTATVTAAITASEAAIRGTDADDLKDISDELASALAAILAAIGAVAGGSHVLWTMEEKLIRPDSGSTAYPIIIDIKDSAGNPEAPDSAPTITITNYSGTVRVAETPMTQVGADVGVYRYNYTITSVTPLEKQIVRVKVIEGGVTNYYDEVTEVYEEGGAGAGTGAYPVDHNYGSTDALRICESGVVPDTGIGGVWIYAYLKADFDAGLRGDPYRKGLSHTEDDGRWANAMMLVSGETYRIVCQGGTYYEETSVTEITIP